jgi:hypothetical protein
MAAEDDPKFARYVYTAHKDSWTWRSFRACSLIRPTTDGRALILSRYTELNTDQKLLVKQLKLDLPSQPPPRITTAPAGQGNGRRDPVDVVETFGEVTLIFFTFSLQSAN